MQSFIAPLCCLSRGGVVSNVENQANVVGIGAAGVFAAGLIGKIVDVSCNSLLNNCSNHGHIISSGVAGGLIGLINTQYNVVFNDCSNSGDVNATLNAGGFACCDSSCNVELYNCLNTGSIGGGSEAVGFVHYVNKACHLVNKGKVSAANGTTHALVNECSGSCDTNFISPELAETSPTNDAFVYECEKEICRSRETKERVDKILNRHKDIVNGRATSI